MSQAASAGRTVNEVEGNAEHDFGHIGCVGSEVAVSRLAKGLGPGPLIGGTGP